MEDTSQRAERLRQAGLRVTAPRLAILGAVEANRRHPSAEEVLQNLRARHPSLSLSTVYATLTAFMQAGLVRKAPGRDGRLRVDGMRKEHDHAVCRGCGSIFDLDPRRTPPPPAPKRLPGSLKVLSVRIEYEVLCASCAGAD